MSPRSLSSPSRARETAAPTDAASPALWLIRHGESTWNVAGLAQGHNDEAELTERGRRQADALAAQFGYRPVRAIYASDLRRAQQTGAAFAAVLGLPVYSDTRLRERSLGVLEGTESRAIGPSVTGIGNGRVVDPDTRPAGGESVRDLYLRAAAFCDDLAAALLDGPGAGTGLTGAESAGTSLPRSERSAASLTGAGGDVLIIAHGGTVRVIDAYLHGVPVDQMTWRPVDNATIVQIPEFGLQPRGGNR